MTGNKGSERKGRTCSLPALVVYQYYTFIDARFYIREKENM